jgi:hypothetical protein
VRPVARQLLRHRQHDGDEHVQEHVVAADDDDVGGGDDSHQDSITPRTISKRLPADPASAISSF